MQNLVLPLIGLTALAFVLAVVVVLFSGPIMDVSAEGFSRACTNLALLAVAVSLASKGGAGQS